MDSAPPQSPELAKTSEEPGLKVDTIRNPESHTTEGLGLALDDLWREAEADRVDLEKSELAEALLAVGVKYNYGLAAGIQATSAQALAFWRAVHLKELALAQACALGRETAWRQFVAGYRAPITQVAIALTGSASLGQDLADSIFSEMFGLSTRDGERRSPLASYAGRGTLLGFLRTSLAQRHVDHQRRTHRETPLEDRDFASASQPPVPESAMLVRLREALTVTLRSLNADERFLLSAWFLDRQTLLEIAHLWRVHESTISRQLKRLTARLQKELLKNLRAGGLSRQAAEDSLGTDPRDLAINIRSILQASQTAAFPEQGTQPGPEQA